MGTSQQVWDRLAEPWDLPTGADSVDLGARSGSGRHLLAALQAGRKGPSSGGNPGTSRTTPPSVMSTCLQPRSGVHAANTLPTAPKSPAKLATSLRKEGCYTKYPGLRFSSMDFSRAGISQKLFSSGGLTQESMTAGTADLRQGPAPWGTNWL